MDTSNTRNDIKPQIQKPPESTAICHLGVSCFQSSNFVSLRVFFQIQNTYVNTVHYNTVPGDMLETKAILSICYIYSKSNK